MNSDVVESSAVTCQMSYLSISCILHGSTLLRFVHSYKCKSFASLPSITLSYVDSNKTQNKLRKVCHKCFIPHQGFLAPDVKNWRINYIAPMTVIRMLLRYARIRWKLM